MPLSGRQPRNIGAQRFSRRQRLTAAGEFTRVMARAERSADQHFTVLACAGAGEHARLGLAISKKAARRAVDRNRIKRLARESFRHCNAGRAMDIVVFARQQTARQDAGTLRASLDRHFRCLLAAQPRSV